MTSKELIAKLDSHMLVNKITRKSVADKLGVSSAEVCRKLSADNCGLFEFSEMYYVCIGNKSNNLSTVCLIEDCYRFGYDKIAEKLETSPAKVKRMLSSENMKLSTFLKLTDAAGVTSDYFKFD
jgi:hypothetical protein